MIFEKPFQNNFHKLCEVFIRFFYVAKVFEYYHIIVLLTIFKDFNKASRSQILLLEKINNNFTLLVKLILKRFFRFNNYFYFQYNKAFLLPFLL